LGQLDILYRCNTMPSATCKIWLQAARPRTLAVSLSPVMVGTAFAYRHGATGMWHYAVLFWLFALAIQIATNFHNDYADFVKGADTEDRLGEKRAAQMGLLTEDQLKFGTAIALTSALSFGIPLIFRGGWFFVVIVFTSMLNAVMYTGGPWPLGAVGLGDISTGYSGFGDVLVLMYFGFVAVCGTYYLQTMALPWEIIFAAFPVGLLATAVIVPNNLRDRFTDAKVGKRTLAVRFGELFARSEYASLVVMAFCSLLAWPLGFSGARSGFPVLLPMLALPKAGKCIAAVAQRDGRDLNEMIGGTAKMQLQFCILFAAGAVLG